MPPELKAARGNKGLEQKLVKTEEKGEQERNITAQQLARQREEQQKINQELAKRKLDWEAYVKREQKINDFCDNVLKGVLTYLLLQGALAFGGWYAAKDGELRVWSQEGYEQRFNQEFKFFAAPGYTFSSRYFCGKYRAEQKRNALNSRNLPSGR